MTNNAHHCEHDSKIYYFFKIITDNKPGCEKAVGLFSGSAEEVPIKKFTILVLITFLIYVVSAENKSI